MGRTNEQLVHVREQTLQERELAGHLVVTLVLTVAVTLAVTVEVTM